MQAKVSFWKAGHWPTLVSAFLDVSFMVVVLPGILGAASGLGGFLLPTLLGTLKEITGSYAARLTAFGGLSVAALVCLVIVQRKWIGDWIAEHGRVLPVAPALPAEDAEPA